jgi:NADP-dependent 3-hydroxy acid dehydrogenase YdfG
VAVEGDSRATERPAIVGGGNLVGKTAAILGASGVYGTATARILGREGVNLVLGGRSRDKLEALEKEITDSVGQAPVVGTHLAKRHHPAHLVEAAVEAFGGLDVLLFMACVCAPSLGSLDLDAWERSVDVNVKGFLYTLAAALPVMREGSGGHVVSLSVEDQETADPLYEASRAAVRVILQELNRELSGEGIRASEVRLEGLRRVGPERCAKSVHRLLADPPDNPTRFSVRRVPEA